MRNETNYEMTKTQDTGFLNVWYKNHHVTELSS